MKLELLFKCACLQVRESRDFSRVEVSNICIRQHLRLDIKTCITTPKLCLKDLIGIVTIKQGLEVMSATSIENRAVWNTVNFLVKVSLYGWQARRIRRRSNLLRR